MSILIVCQATTRLLRTRVECLIQESLVPRPAARQPIVLTLEPLYESLTLLSEALVSNVLIIYQKSWKPHNQFRFKIKQFVFRKTPNLAYFLSQYHIHRSDQDTLLMRRKQQNVEKVL